MSLTPKRDRNRLARIVRRLLGPDGMTSKELNARCAEVGERTGMNRTTVLRMSNGSVLPEFKNLITVMAVLGATAQEVADAELLHKAARAKTSAPLDHAEMMNTAYAILRLNERDAVRVQTVCTTLPHGLLQPKPFVEALTKRQAQLFEQGLIPPGWLSSAVNERETRQALLYADDRRRLELHAVIYRSALVHGFGGPDVMEALYDRLLAAAAEPNITIQVQDEDLDAKHIPVSGQFTIHVFDDDPESPYEAYLESALGTHEVAGDDGIKTLLTVWRSSVETALSPEQSVRYIEELRNKVRAR